MKKIILASKSLARKNLLKSIGIKIITKDSGVLESRNLTSNCAYLVKVNALRKARAIANKMKSGIVIGADTVVGQGHRLYGKPKDLKEARLMLKTLSARPHWIYTGLALIDVEKNKYFLDYEKTKVYMHKLSDKEIDRYFLHSNPLDKAGGFDIQGKGALFIRRIEGCFYNVVGLPLAKLYSMFKKIGLNLFLLAVNCLLITFLSGCATEYNVATNKEEWIYYSSEQEANMGASISKQVIKEFKVSDNDLMRQKVKEIGKKITNVCDRKDLIYYFDVLSEDEVNAFSLPGGYVYVNSGLMDKATDDELACVLAHEVGHIVAKHAVKRLQAMIGYNVVRILAATTGGAAALQGADVAFITLLSGYSKEDEFLADKLSAKYAQLAGYDPKAMIDFLDKLHEIMMKKPSSEYVYWRTHPFIADRIRVVKQYLGLGMDFKDYMNIEDRQR